MKKTFIVLVCLVSISTTLAWAQGRIKFATEKHNFGKIQEEGGPAQFSFEFTNTGNAPITLTNVKASCGCTTPTWTKEAIEAGKTGVVTASYDPMNRPGPFTKSITVNTDGEPNTLVLNIEGDVIARKKSVKDWYPTEAGNLRMISRNIYFNKVYHDGNATQKFVVFNQGEKPVNINIAESIKSLPKYVTLQSTKSLVNPKDSVIFNITFDAKKQTDWDYVTANFTLITDDEKESQKKLYVSGNIVENFGNITNQSKIPQATFDKLTHSFGTINQNTVNTVSFKLTNNGQAPLIIRKTKASCGCTASEPKKMLLAVGESTSIDVTYSSGTKSGRQSQNVTIITNDPAQPKQLLRVEADVIAPNANTPTTPNKGGK
jgi:hypothetical protein